MFREIDDYLQGWLTRRNRKPLILRGARQVGKTWAVRELARSQGLKLIEINFELQPALKAAFATPDPAQILKYLGTYGVQLPQPGKSLLVFDEIQECPQAIVSLRYFYELMPDQAVIATGSLLEFTLMRERVSWPVGRVEFAWMYPMSFSEYVRAKGNPGLAEALKENPLKSDSLSGVHSFALGELREYLFCGGMPKAVLAMTQDKDPAAVRREHLEILHSYRLDFHKYAPRIDADLAEKMFLKAPSLVGGRFKYSHIDPDRTTKEIKPAVEALEKAGIIRLVIHTAAQGLPLAVDTNPRICKLLFLDVGLMHASQGIDNQLVQEPSLLAIHRGAVAEQFVGQELLATAPADREPELWFWSREAAASQSEIDYIITRGSKVLPIEVKAGASGRLKSMRIFLDSHGNSPKGVRFYDGKPWDEEGRIEHLPLYSVGSLRNQLS